MTQPLTITDAQIRALRRHKTWSTLWLRVFAVALGEVVTVNDPAGDRAGARARCAEIIDDLHGAFDLETA